MRRFLAQTSRTVAVFTAGLVLVVAGLAGLALPILPGWILVIAGIAIWSREFSWAMRLRQWLGDHVRSVRDRVREKVRERTAEHAITREPETDASDPGPAANNEQRRETTGIDAA